MKFRVFCGFDAKNEFFHSLPDSALTREVLFYDLSLFNDDVRFRYILMHAAVAGGFFRHRIDHIHTFDHFAKYGVTPAIRGRAGVIQETIVFVIDEKFCY